MRKYYYESPRICLLEVDFNKETRVLRHSYVRADVRWRENWVPEEHVSLAKAREVTLEEIIENPQWWETEQKYYEFLLRELI